ncbi:MAG: Thymidylate kinase (EC [uncultured Sulfurovum sp.]|uniref:Thymidylate kinase (EC) n=1 Tax=uncultured Sulfurovum sp. TaxID=269237 RepID=A0A6S6T233_9BACT|nr:MAG: Thymidylate kinase (EC [uncultured Sulfurovum sp.]
MSNVPQKEQINWSPYSQETLQKAKNENKSIFLFISSTSSQWSKKMQEDSFEDPTIIELLNERFIPIFVNKDERPDIERYYHKVYSLMNRETTGSPLSLFLTANLEPFYAGSYIPSEEINDQLSLESLLRIISKKYITDYDTLAQKGQEVLSHVNTQKQSIQATKLNIDVSKTIIKHMENLLDSEFGGFSKAPKFPNTTTLNLLLDVYELEKNAKLLSAITLTLDHMIKGGFYDLENGAFYNYSKDKTWSQPYEVKTTYDNAQLLRLYLRAYTLTENETYKKIAIQSIDFMLKARQNNKLFAFENEEIITSWNAEMVKTLFAASNIDAKYKIHAVETLEAILSELYVSGTLYHTKKVDAKAHIAAFLEDYASLGEASITAYQYTLDESFLIMATQFSNLIIEQYYEQARWVYSKGDFKLRESIHDMNIPSSVSTSLSLLLSISSLVDNNYKKFVFKTLELHSYNLMRQPLSSPKLTQMVLRYLKDDIIIKGNENLLKPHIGQREKLSYPYVYFKTSNEALLHIDNSHSTLKKEKTFEDVKQYLKNL